MNRVKFTLNFMPAAFLVVLILFSPADAPASEPEWGTRYSDFIKRKLPGNITEFMPRDKPDYKHKILKYITGIKPDVLDKTKVVRVTSGTSTDYMFINSKLYTILKDWNIIPAEKEKALFSDLKNRYGNPQVKVDGNLKIFSFKKDRTKVIYYRLSFNNGTSRCRVYSYTTRLFRMLFMEQ